jgi:type IV secretion system protein VirD4
LNHQGGAPLYDRSGYSVLCEAPTGGGKTAGTIIPAVLEWPGSLVVVDVKGEIFEKTSGYLAREGVDVVCLDPDAPVHGYNPLATVRRDSHVEIDARNLSRILTNPRGRPLVGNEIHFVDNATTLLTAAILRGIEGDPEGVTLADVFYLLSSELKTELRSWLDSGNTTVRLTAERFLPHVSESGTSREFMSIHSTALTALDLFKEPLMAKLTSASSFSPATLKERRQAIYYLASTPARLATTAAYVRLLFQGVIETLTRVGEGHRGEVLLVLDEFPVLGCFEFLVDAFGWMRSYGIRALVAIQGYSQLRNLYGTNEVVSLHTRTKIVYPGTDIASSDQLSRYLGRQTIATESKSSSYGRHPSSGKTRSETGRELLMPDEVRALSPESAFVLTQGCRPIKARPALWFRDGSLRKKVALGAAALTPDPKLRDFTPRRRPAPEDVLLPAQARELPHLLDL